MIFRSASIALACLLSLALSACAQKPQDHGPTVLAAASMQEALSKVADSWAAQGHARPVISFAGTPALARQVEAGAEADIAIFADEAWMDRIADKALLRKGTRKPLLGNGLVVIVPAGGYGSDDRRTEPNHSAQVAPMLNETLNRALGRTLSRTLGRGRIAMGDPDHVPAGRYAKASLLALDLWPELSSRIIPAENVRAALALVERGEVPAAIVYTSDALASDKVRIAARFPADSHPPIRYPVAQLASSRHRDAAAFLAFLNSPDAASTFREHGFEVVSQ